MKSDLEEIKEHKIIEEEIKHLENQIEKTNRNLILIDHNIINLALSLKKLVRNYKLKEQDLREKFAAIKKELQTKVMDKCHKKLLLEIITLASTEIINCQEMQKNFYKEITLRFPNNMK